MSKGLIMQILLKSGRKKRIYVINNIGKKFRIEISLDINDFSFPYLLTSHARYSLIKKFSLSFDCVNEQNIALKES